MDDQMSTPISSIYPPAQQQQADMFPPLPQVQSNNHPQAAIYNQMQQHMQQQEPEVKVPIIKEENDMDKTQQELMFLFVIILVISSEPVQRQLMTSFPALFSDAKSSIVASAINAGVICGLFYALRHIKITV
jgi:hypothetical protein